ncbi:F-box/kelch-repeat protein At3g06240-like [Chenopodium quinoa]|uniref:F-box/kelch-repeat protein At3g06240-like n=1 Tax=Chenopodium quinoa TaxID=63459 RepID=UPI000B77341D|nr:F-box/kelch-repeat protein At3g06240-like [Chenopodium quinoa]
MPISAPYTLQLSNVAFGYESITRDYRCVRINRNTSTMTNSIESDVMVYSLKDDSWRKAATPNVPYNLRFLGCYNTDSVFLNGAIHWYGFINEPLRNVSIVTFNLREECFSTLPVPNLVSIGIGRMFVGVLDGSLCLVVNESWGDTHLWVMKEYGIPESWTKLFSFAKLNTSVSNEHMNWNCNVLVNVSI